MSLRGIYRRHVFLGPGLDNLGVVRIVLPCETGSLGSSQCDTLFIADCDCFLPSMVFFFLLERTLKLYYKQLINLHININNINAFLYASSYQGVNFRIQFHIVIPQYVMQGIE